MIFDPLYWIVIGVGMALSLWASAVTKSRFAKYSQIGTRSHMTGAQVAESILRDNDIHDVRIEPVRGNLTDHYDPRTHEPRAAAPVDVVTSMAAFGAAAPYGASATSSARSFP